MAQYTVARVFYFFFSSRRRHTRFKCDWSSDVCSSDLIAVSEVEASIHILRIVSTQVFLIAPCGRFLAMQFVKLGRGQLVQVKGWVNEIGRASCRERV